MQKVADFRIQINRVNKQFQLILSAEGDEFEIELEDPQDLIDEVDELVHDKLVKFGVVPSEH